MSSLVRRIQRNSKRKPADLKLGSGTKLGVHTACKCEQSK